VICESKQKYKTIGIFLRETNLHIVVFLSWANVLLESTEYVLYVKANKSINVIKQLAFFYVEHGVVVKLLT
jgi:hypothetical protein